MLSHIGGGVSLIESSVGDFEIIGRDGNDYHVKDLENGERMTVDEETIIRWRSS